MSNQHKTVIHAIRKLLKPLVRLLLRYGFSYGEFAELVKKTYVDVANEDFVVNGKKQSLSRVAVLTGIHRHEVGKLLKMEWQDEDTSHSVRHNRTARIISAWQSDADFSTGGIARVLDLETEFPALVSRHGTDVTTRSVLDELERIGAVKRPNKEQVQLLVEAFAPQNNADDLIYIIGDCTADLLETLDYNISKDKSHHRLQMSVVYNNLPDEVLHNLELISRDKSMKFLTELNQFFMTQDRDSNPNLKGEGQNRAGIGLYYFQQSIDEDNNS